MTVGPRTGREFVEHVSHIARFRALDHRDEGPLLSVGCLVRERRPQFAVRHGHLVNAQTGGRDSLERASSLQRACVAPSP